MEQQQMASMGMNSAGMMMATPGMPTTPLSASGQPFSDAARRFVVSSTAPREEEDYDTWKRNASFEEVCHVVVVECQEQDLQNVILTSFSVIIVVNSLILLCFFSIPSEIV